MNKTILVVDGSKTIRKQVSYILGKKSWNVLEANNGRTAFETLKYNPETSVILSEIEMPTCDGIEMMHMIEADEQLRGVPLIVLTIQGHEAQKKEVKGIYKEIKGWLSKPVDEKALVELLGTIEKAI